MENELRQRQEPGNQKRKSAISATAKEGESSSDEEVRATCSERRVYKRSVIHPGF